MLAGLIASGYAVYAVFVGTANGLHEFFKQAGAQHPLRDVRVGP